MVMKLAIADWELISRNYRVDELGANSIEHSKNINEIYNIL